MPICNQYTVQHHAWSRYTEMFETGCEAALMVGMHARAGTPDGVLCHTISTVKWKNLWFNRQIPPVRARQMIEEGAYRALQDLTAVPPYTPTQPTTITVEVDTPDKALEFKGRYGVEFIEPLKVVSRAPTWMEAWDQIWHW